MFFYSGIGMLLMQGPANVAVYFDSLSIPLAGLMAWVVIALKLGAGGALMAGYKVEEAAGALAVFTLIATFIAHMDMADPSLGKNLAIVGGLLLAAGHASAKRNVANANSAL
jgi:putative oxidoreductase